MPLDIYRSIAIAHGAEHLLVHAVPRLTAATVHTEPHSDDRAVHHGVLADHR